jgi:serine/threonine-protein kinase
MSPEQARGEQDSIDGRSDVFGLGGVLYTLLCYQAPFRGRTIDEILQAARTGTVIPPSKMAPKRIEVPPDLEAICMKALSPQMENRHADTREFQQDLQSYIEGTRDRERRRAQALALVGEGRKQIASFLQLEKKRREMRSEAQKSAESVLPADPVEKKKPLWDMEDAVGRLGEESAKLFSGARATLDAAIQTDPGCQEARKALADLYWSQFLEAEARRDSHNAALYRGLVETHDSGQYKSLLLGDGTLSLRTDPPGAEAVLYRYVEEDRLLVPSDARSLGTTPLGPVSLPMGSYLVVLKLEGYRDVRYPVGIGRAEKHLGVVRLFTEEEIGGDFVYVPGGEFIRGGDPESFGGFERSRVAVGDFFISRFPVTLGEYCEFLDSLTHQGVSVEEHLPRLEKDVFLERDASGRYQPAENLVEGETRKRYPPGFEKGCPALAVSWHSAMAYARWRSKRDGREYELPTENAWEKAARGVDGRFHVWGDAFDWTFAKGGLSRPERTQPEPVGVFPTDESPYGIRDMAGTIREWTQSWFDERADMRVVRGGSWNLVGTRHFRCANRFGYSSTKGTSTVGFRLFSTHKARRR